MTNTSDVIHALPSIANALGRRYGVRVFIGGERAFTNGKDIHIPALPIDADETVLSLARGYIDHEAAHLRITDFEAVKTASLSQMERHIWNTIEDHMVERTISALYPGCATNLRWLSKYIFGTQPAEPKHEERKEVSSILNWLLYSLRSLDVPELSIYREHLAKTLDATFPGLRIKLEQHLRAIPDSCRDTAACIDMARIIVAELLDYINTNQPQQPEEKGGSADTETQNEDTSANTTVKTGATPVYDENRSVPSTPEDKPVPDSQAHSEPATSQPQDGSATKNADSALSVEEGTDSQTESSTPLQQLEQALAADEMLEGLDIGAKAGEILERLDRTQAADVLAVATPVLSCWEEFEAHDLTEIKKQTAALRTRLYGLLQAKAEVRARPARTGNLDTKRAARLAALDTRIFARRTSRVGINTAVHILLDASYSMNDGKMELAAKACYALALAFENVRGVDVGVTAFPGPISVDDVSSINDPTVSVVKRHGQKMHSRFKVECCGTTPLAEALWWLLGELASLKQPRKIILLLSDGLPDNQHMAEEALATHMANGTEVYGVGIETTAMTTLLPNANSRSIYNLLELPSAMFELLHHGLFQRGG